MPTNNATSAVAPDAKTIEKIESGRPLGPDEMNSLTYAFCDKNAGTSGYKFCFGVGGAYEIRPMKKGDKIAVTTEFSLARDDRYCQGIFDRERLSPESGHTPVISINARGNRTLVVAPTGRD